jgi:adenosylmethionine-8-amino-7-oxononanoate aminotransferase
MKKPVDVAGVQKAFVDRGVWLRPFGALIYVMPPFVMNGEDLARLTDAIFSVVGELDTV